MRHLLLLIISFSFGFHLLGQQMHIGLLRQFKINELSVTPEQKCSYVIQADSIVFDTLFAGEKLHISLQEGAIRWRKNEQIFRSCMDLKLVACSKDFSLKIQALSPSSSEKKYNDNLHLIAKNKRIDVINDVNLRHYLAGVIESEGGGNQSLEYYKVQAIISRTYAIKNLNRHKDEGFQLCDGVHCQAYRSKLRFTPEIQTAVDETKEIVLTDANGKLIDAFFHANCGGQTSEAQYVWNFPLNYIHSFVDTFCIHTPQAHWKKNISKNDWKTFLISRYAYPINDSILGPGIYSFEQKERLPFYKDPSLGIPLRDLRQKFHLKSTFFSCHPEGDFVVLEGRGYGHGIGLCQEGAMNMAKHGYSYEQILKFYFSDIQLCLYENLHYFKQSVNSPFDF